MFMPPVERCAAVGEDTLQNHAVLLVEGQDPVVEEIGRRDRRLAIIELGEADLGIGVDEGLLIDSADALQGADVEGVLHAAIARTFGFELPCTSFSALAFSSAASWLSVRMKRSCAILLRGPSTGIPQCPGLAFLTSVNRRSTLWTGVGAGRRLAEGRKMLCLPSSRTHLSHGLHRTHDNRTPYAVDVTGGGRSSAINRRMSVNRFLGMGRVAEGNFTPPPSRNRT
jgi:hypothetical protein